MSSASLSCTRIMSVNASIRLDPHHAPGATSLSRLSRATELGPSGARLVTTHDSGRHLASSFRQLLIRSHGWQAGDDVRRRSKMLVCLVGPQAAGKTAIANVLVEDLGFTRVRVGPQPGPARDGILTPPSASTSKASAASARDELHFRSAEAFLDYSTLNWRKDFVTTDLRERDDVEIFVKRPWFLAVAVEAGIVERWRRAVQRFVMQ